MNDVRAVGGQLASTITARAVPKLKSFVMSLAFGRRSRAGVPSRPVAGDLVLLAVLSPQEGVIGPSGWTEVPGGECPAFWKLIGPAETDPVFHAASEQAKARR